MNLFDMLRRSIANSIEYIHCIRKMGHSS